MKIYSAALILALAYAQTTEEPTETVEETTEETTEEPKVFGGPITWDEEGTNGDGGSFSATVTYSEDAEGVMQVQSSVVGSWNTKWEDVNNSANKKFWGGAMLMFAQTSSEEDEAGETVETTTQEGWYVGGQRDSSSNNNGEVDVSFNQITLLAAATPEWSWVGAPPAAEGDQTNVWVNGTGAIVEDESTNPDVYTGVTGSADRPGEGNVLTFKDLEDVTVWGGCWISSDSTSNASAWGKAAMKWDLEKPVVEEKETEVVEEEEEGASNLVVSAAAAVALIAFAF